MKWFTTPKRRHLAVGGVLIAAACLLAANVLFARPASANHAPGHVDLAEKGLLLDRQGFYPWSDIEIGPNWGTPGNEDVTMWRCGCLLASISTVANYMAGGEQPWFPMVVKDTAGNQFGFTRGAAPIYVDRFLREGNHQPPPELHNWGYNGKANSTVFGTCGLPFPRMTALETMFVPRYVNDGSGGLIQVGKTGFVFAVRHNLMDPKTAKLVRDSLQSDRPVIAAYHTRDKDGNLTGRGHAVVVVGYDPADGKFRVVNPAWPFYDGFSEVPKARGIDPAVAYTQWEDDVYTIMLPIPSQGSTRYFQLSDDPGAFDMMSINPQGQRTGVDANGVTYNEDDAVADITSGAWDDPTGTVPAGDEVRDIYVRNPKPGTHRFQFVAKKDTRLKLDFVDSPANDTTGGTRVLQVDEQLTAGQVKKYEMGYTGSGTATAAQVASFAPFAKAGEDQNGLTGRALTFNAMASYDPDDSIATYAWNFGDGASATGLERTHAYQNPGDYTVTLTVTDVAGRTATDTQKVHIDLSQQKPVAMVSGPVVVIATRNAFLSSSDSFDRNNDPLTYKWDFGDGTTATTTNEQGIRHTYAQPGDYTVTLVVNDGHEDSAPATTTAKVLQFAPETLSVPACVNPGQIVTVGLNNKIVRPDWDYGFNGAVIPPPTVQEAQADIDNPLVPFGGEYGRPEGWDSRLTVQAVQADTELWHSLVMSWHVPDDYAAEEHIVGFQRESPDVFVTIVSPCPQPQNVAPTAHAGGPSYTVAANRPLTLDGTRSSDPDGNTLTYRWSLGNGQEATAVKPSVTYSVPGTYRVSLTVNDGQLNSEPYAESFATVTVTEGTGNAPPQASAGADGSGTEGAAVQLNGTASDPDGDAVTSSWSYAAKEGVDNGAICTFGNAAAAATTFTCTDDGKYEVTLTATDGQETVTDTAAITVANANPVVAEPSVPIAPVPVFTVVQASASFTDAGSHDTHQASINWDDGTTATGSITNKTVSGSHIYMTAGVYTVCVSVTDDDNGTGTGCTVQRVVVYDPAGGFVTGGGWIDSPAGAYTPGNPNDPDLTGRTNFGFVAKYKNNDALPSGSTEFQFQSGNINFHATSYEWLMVTTGKATFRGNGRVNNQGDYKFIVTIGDGTPDTFRIKIWDAATNAVLYDTQPGAADTATATKAINSGSIIIHKQ